MNAPQDKHIDPPPAEPDPAVSEEELEEAWWDRVFDADRDEREYEADRDLADPGTGLMP